MPTKEVKRSELWRHHAAGWCPECGRIVPMIREHTGMPGIVSEQCPRCKFWYMYNFLESGDDLLEVPAHLVMMPEEPEVPSA